MVNNITVVIPCFNNIEYTKKTIESLVSCTTSSLSIIIVDDCSTDNTEVEILELDKKFHCITYVKNSSNKGVNASWNIGIKEALNGNAEYIVIRFP